MRRRVTAVAAVVCGGLALSALAHGAGGIGASTGAGAASGAGASSAPLAPGISESPLVASGRALFSSSCAACHGLGAQGVRGHGPSLRGVGALAADFYLETGRMPLSSSGAQPMRTRPAFAQAQIRALIAYVASFGGPAVPSVELGAGSLARGHSLFALDCAGCHTIQGQGGIVTGAIVPSLNEATPTQVAEAIRVGPYVMPRFGPGEISAAGIDSIARYLQSTKSPDDRGGWGIGRIGPIPEGMVAWLLAVAALVLVARLIGERTPARAAPPASPPPGERR